MACCSWLEVLCSRNNYGVEKALLLIHNCPLCIYVCMYDVHPNVTLYGYMCVCACGSMYIACRINMDIEMETEGIRNKVPPPLPPSLHFFKLPSFVQHLSFDLILPPTKLPHSLPTNRGCVPVSSFVLSFLLPASLPFFPSFLLFLSSPPLCSALLLSSSVVPSHLVTPIFFSHQKCKHLDGTTLILPSFLDALSSFLPYITVPSFRS